LILIGLTVSIVGILYFKRWALRLYHISVALVFAWSGLPFILFFSYRSILGIIDILLIVLPEIALWFSFKKTTLEHFGLGYIWVRQQRFKKFKQIFFYLSWILLVGMLGYYAISYFIIYPKQRIIYTPKDNSYFSFHYVRRDIFNLSLHLPQNLNILQLGENSLFCKKSYFRIFSNPEKTVKLGIDLDPSGQLYKYFGYKNSYEFHRRLYRFLRFIFDNFSKKR